MIAVGAFRSNHPSVYEMKSQNSSGLSSHKAVLRFRDPKVGLLLGCDFKEIVAYKAVLFFGQLYEQPTITMNNLYSLKLYNRIEERSLLSLGKVKRYFIQEREIVLPDVNYDHELVAADKGCLSFKIEEKVVEAHYDFCICTLPLPVLLKALKLKHDFFKFQSVYIKRMNLNFFSDVHQTIYVPEAKYKTYRVTLENDLIIFESVGGFADQKEIKELLFYFGFGFSDLKKDSFSEHEQKMGKLIGLNEDFRKKILMFLTINYNIYLFGRYAIWKPLRADDLVSDVEKIRRMINFSEIGREYESYLN